jgi:uncharacterized protein (DUF1810 family)
MVGAYLSKLPNATNALKTIVRNPVMAVDNLVKKLEEFVLAQDLVYEQVLEELRAGHKRTHWIWFIFPQMSSLGTSSIARRFGITSKAEATTYLAHPVLGPRLRECTRLMLAVPREKIKAILGYPDNLKFRSCMTLFAAATFEKDSLFDEALEKFFKGERDHLTLKLLERDC